MVKSMTGFGRSEYTDEKRSIIVEIKSVNHRYSDISVRMPRRYSFAEDKIKNAVKETLRRGKVDISILVENIAESDVNVKLNTMIARQYYDNLKELAGEFGLDNNITLQFLATLPDVMKSMPDVEDEEEMTKALLAATDGALAKIDEMRTAEGAKLAEDLIMRGETIRMLAKKIEQRSPLVTKAYEEKLRERITELVGKNVAVPEDRILLEAAIFADKSSITEELVRLDSHTMQLKNILSNSNQPDGKKLDFLVQEMNREVNTTGSKSSDLILTGMVVDAKAELEKIREQIQNIE